MLRKMNLPLATGLYTHQGLAAIISGQYDAVAASQDACTVYQADAQQRGLNIDQDESQAFVMDEQTALLTALVHGFDRVVWPALREEYEVVDVEREEQVALAEDVLFQARPDALVRRRRDDALFIVNFKTAASCDTRWARRFESDMQMHSECLAVEARLGVKLAGVIVIGLQKGIRLEDKDKQGKSLGRRNRSCLIYGYKTDSNPPVSEAEYTSEYTSKKGWHRFNVWEEATFGASPAERVAHWVGWLPLETVTAQFSVLDPILRNDAWVARWQTQALKEIVRLHESKRAVQAALEHGPEPDGSDWRWLLDAEFPLNDAALQRYGYRSDIWDLEMTANVADDPVGSGLYLPREPHHPVGGDE